VSNDRRDTKVGNDRLMRGVALAAMVTALTVVSPAMGQSAGTTPSAPPSAAANRTHSTAPDSPSGQDIVVTGSRAIVNGTSAPTPMTVVSTEQLNAAAPSSIIDGLNELPVFASSIRPNSTGSSGSGQGGNGGNYLNLRALTPGRTLVLLDGRRTVSSSIQQNATDVTLFPQLLMSRVDVVTGGASAAYGSDAVAGVVNFIIDNKFKGLKAEAQNGISTYGDSHSYRLGVAGGMGFGEGRGHLIGSFESTKVDGINDPNARAWAAKGYGIIPSTGPTTQIIAPDIALTGATFGGTIQACTPAGANCTGLINRYFNPDGSTSPFVNGTQVSSSAQSGGSGARIRTNLGTGSWTNTAYLRGEYEFSEHAKVFAEGIYGDVNTHYLGAPDAITTGSTGITIFSDNAYLPAAIKTLMSANGITSFRLGRANADITPNYVTTHTKTWREVLGLSGKFGGFEYTLAGEHSNAHYHLISDNNLIFSNFYNAADAVVDPSSNQIVCRSALLGLPQGSGCTPINLFGDGSPSAAAKNYVTGSAVADLYLRQTNLNLDLRTSPFSTWAGPVSLAFGGEYRNEHARQAVDPISGSLKNGTNIRGFPTSLQGTPGGFNLTNPQPIQGGFNVKEGYLEASVPLAHGSRFLKELGLNGAVRYASYSNVGGVWTWKVGATWTPIEGIRFRGTRSRDIRAAGISELFTGAQQTAGLSVRDTTQPGAPVATPVTRFTQGNTSLKPEKANTTTGGVVLTPMRGLNLSVDYYTIHIADAITQAALQQVVDGCAAGDSSLCSLISRGGVGGSISSIVTPYLNLASIQTNGIDVELGYRTKVGANALNFRVFGNRTFHLKTTNAGITVDRAGDMGVVQGNTVARWTVTGSVDFSTAQGLGLFVQERFISSGKYDSTLGPTALPVDQNHVPAVFYTDLTIKQRIGPPNHSIEVFTTINNLLDRDPPLAPQGATTIPRYSNAFFYDFIGRYFTVGVRARF